MSDPIDNISPNEERPADPAEEQIPLEDTAIPADELPVTQEDDPEYADLGAFGEGDLAPEDDPHLQGDPDGPNDLRTEL